MRQTANLSQSITMAGAICLTASFGTLLPSTVNAATISSITLGTETSVSASTISNGITYQGYSRSITSFASGGTNWNPINLSVDTTLTLKRSGSAPTTADTNKQVVWERCATATDCSNSIVRGTVPTTTASALSQNNIYLGTDNLLANQGNGSGNQSDVERADFVLSKGYRATSDVGVTVFERGVSTEHDAFAIAAITGFDSTNNPIYGNLLGYARGSWGTTNLLTSSDYLNTRILNNQTGSFALTGNVSQNIGGQLIRLNELVSPNTLVYGYSLFAYDTFTAFSNNTCSLAQLSSVTNTSCYTYNTSDTNGGSAPNGGGIDLLAVNLGLTARQGTTPIPQEVPEPLSIIGTILGGITAFRMKKSIK
jgi:hypothetical protein